jgi:hypothetical protein
MITFPGFAGSAKWMVGAANALSFTPSAAAMPSWYAFREARALSSSIV